MVLVVTCQSSKLEWSVQIWFTAQISWYGVEVARKAHNLKTGVRFSLPQLNSGEMEKKVDAIFSDTLIGILDALNHAKVQRKDVVNIFQNTQGQYVAVFYQ